jgi:hypothetical protein
LAAQKREFQKSFDGALLKALRDGYFRQETLQPSEIRKKIWGSSIKNNVRQHIAWRQKGGDAI